MSVIINNKYIPITTELDVDIHIVTNYINNIFVEKIRPSNTTTELYISNCPALREIGDHPNLEKLVISGCHHVLTIPEAKSVSIDNCCLLRDSATIEKFVFLQSSFRTKMKRRDPVFPNLWEPLCYLSEGSIDDGYCTDEQYDGRDPEMRGMYYHDYNVGRQNHILIPDEKSGWELSSKHKRIVRRATRDLRVRTIVEGIRTIVEGYYLTDITTTDLFLSVTYNVNYPDLSSLVNLLLLSLRDYRGDSICDYDRLETLFLDKVMIDEVARNQNLTFLDLMRSDVTLIHDLCSLRKLVMDSSRVKSISNLENLIELKIRHSKIGSIDSLDSLETLEIFKSSTSMIPPTIKLINLTIEDADHVLSRECCHLNSLKLKESATTSIDFPSIEIGIFVDCIALRNISNLANLTYLTITNCAIDSLSSFKNLKTLSVTSCAVTAIFDLPRLEELKIDSCPNLRRISKLPRLELLKLENCPLVTCISNLDNLKTMTLVEPHNIHRMFNLRRLTYLEVKKNAFKAHCFSHLPLSICNIRSLKRLKVSTSSSVYSIHDLDNLQELDVVYSRNLNYVYNLPSLVSISIQGCGMITSIPVSSKVKISFCRFLSHEVNKNGTINYNRVLKLQRFFRRIILVRAMIRLANNRKFIEIYYHPDSKGGWIAKKNIYSSLQ